jgi:hypothetical protein
MTMATTKKTGSSSRPTNRTSSKDTATKRASDGATSSDGAAEKAAPRRRTSGSAPRATAPKKKSGMVVAREAAQQLLQLTGKEAEGITGLERTDDGWTVHVEVLELRRIPNTTDVLALYEVTLDEDGELEGYRRLRRYSRGSTGQESG